MDYRQILDRIESKRTGRKKPARETTRNALEELENPENRYRTILIGGTNGKGSVVGMTSELLQNNGKRVGTYRSPHLKTVRERIQVDGEKISKKEFMRLYKEIEDSSDGLSFFEFMTVMAYTYFSRKDVDYAVMEVGMGGRLDATNVVESEISAITNLGEDHKKYLGDTREERAEELAGIIDSKVVLGEMSEELIEAAEDRNAKIIGKKGLDGNANTTLELDEEEFRIPVRGGFQKQNCGIAISIVKELEEIPENLEEAFEDLECPGRMEVISRKPLYIQDGAHNRSAVEEIMKDLPKDFTCVFNASKDKEVEKMISKLEEKASKFYFTESNVEWATKEAEDLAEHTSKEYEIEKNPVEAVRKARKETDRDGCVLATGSLYLIGALKEEE